MSDHLAPDHTCQRSTCTVDWLFEATGLDDPAWLARVHASLTTDAFFLRSKGIQAVTGEPSTAPREIALVLRGERSRELIRLLRRAGAEGITTDDLARQMGMSTLRILSLIGKLKGRHGAPIENLTAWPPGRSNFGRYRLSGPVTVRAPRRVPKSKPGTAPCRCHQMREGRRCPRCTMKEVWSSGRYRRTRPSIRPDVWTAPEDAFLATLVGKSESEMADGFEARFHHRRTGHAIRKRMLDLGLDTRQGGWTVQGLSRLFGVNADRVLRAWIRTGLLNGMRGAPSRQAKLDGTREQWWRIADAEVERFIRTYPWEYDWRTMRQGQRLTSVAREVARQHAYLSLKEAAKALGLHPSKVARLVRLGQLPARRLTPAHGTVGRDIRIAASDLVDFRRLGAAS